MPLCGGRGSADVRGSLGVMCLHGRGGLLRDAGAGAQLWGQGLAADQGDSPAGRDAGDGPGGRGQGRGPRIAVPAGPRLARRAGRTTARLVALAVAGGPGWDQLAQEPAGGGGERRRRRPWRKWRRRPRRKQSQMVISPDFSLESTGFFPGKHLIHFLVLKMKDFWNFVLDNCILDFDAEEVYLMLQVINLKNKEVTVKP